MGSLMHNVYKFISLKALLLGVTFFLIQSVSATSQAYTPYSNKELDELEQDFVQLINQSNQIDRNPLATSYINRLGRQLAHFADIPSATFFIVKSSEINAFAGPGGYIGMNTQLILTTKNESELAGVMAHELAHVRLHHLYQLIEHEKQMQMPMLASMLASIALGAINPALGNGALMASMTGFSQDNINFIRANEKEADRIGIDMLVKAGFNPKGMASFFHKMQLNSRLYYTDNIPAILRTHPLDEERIAEAENRITRLPKQQTKNSLDYALFKELIRTHIITNPKTLLDYYQNKCKKETQIACQYGLSLSLINNNQASLALTKLAPLLAAHPNNIDLNISMAKAELLDGKTKQGLQRLANLTKNFPDNYAALMSYTQALLDSNHAEEATALLLKASRKFKQDLALCETLAHAQSKAKRKAYAYFTQAQCMRLQGREREAYQHLKIARPLAKNDKLLSARIDAVMQDIKENKNN